MENIMKMRTFPVSRESVEKCKEYTTPELYGRICEILESKQDIRMAIIPDLYSHIGLLRAGDIQHPFPLAYLRPALKEIYDSGKLEGFARYFNNIVTNCQMSMKTLLSEIGAADF